MQAPAEATVKPYVCRFARAAANSQRTLTRLPRQISMEATPRWSRS